MRLIPISNWSIAAVLAVTVALFGIGLVGVLSRHKDPATQLPRGGEQRAHADRPVRAAESAQALTTEPTRDSTAPHASAVAGSWARRFQASENYGEFIRSALPAALAGDGDAQYCIAQAVASCRGARELYRGGQITPDWLFDQTPGAYSEAMRQSMRLRYKRCIDYVRNDPFSGLPAAPHRYEADYWVAQAAANGNIDAFIDKATMDWNATDKSTSNAEQRAQQERFLESAVVDSLVKSDFSRVPRLGALLNEASNAKPDAAIALLLAACDLGMPCDSPGATDEQCQSIPSECIQGGQLRDVVVQLLGEKRLMRALVMSDLLQQALKQNDREAMHRILFHR